jgi:antitoxin component of RelBE/YafQ-DinJ toxin-antitoxin module
MTQVTTTQTESVRIDKDLLEKIKIISKSKGQTISGFININLHKTVERQWHKTLTNLEKKENIRF